MRRAVAWARITADLLQEIRRRRTDGQSLGAIAKGTGLSKSAVPDPGVVDVSTAWEGHLPQPMEALPAVGQKAEFDWLVDEESGPAEKSMPRFRMRPYDVSSAYDAFKAAEAYNPSGVADRIECPMLITDPEGEQSWPGQSQAFYDMVRAPRTLVRFTAEEGADPHCEPKALGLRDLRIFDWLDETPGV